MRKSDPAAAPDDDADKAFNTLHVIENDAPNGGSANAAVAADRIQRLADQGDPAAQYDLGYCLENGIGVAMDLYGAYAMYLQAAAVTDDSRLKMVAESGAGAVKAHLAASKPRW
jgi:TPR repeat protein